MSRSLTALAIAIACCAAYPGIATAKGTRCSVHASKGTPQKDLEAMAKVSQDAAQKAALKTFPASAHPEIAESELEQEGGCLVYSFDVKVAGKSGVDEVIVDAGNGEVLSRKHESAAHEAAEKVKETTEKVKEKVTP